MVADPFREDYTGKTLDRPELSKVREMLKARQADVLIVYKTDRLDRSEWCQSTYPPARAKNARCGTTLQRDRAQG